MAKTGLPGISSPLPADVRQFLERVREIVEGLPDTYVTNSALNGSGIGGGGNGQGNGTGISGTADFSPPPAPTGFFVSGAMTTIILSWNSAGRSNIAFTEIWRASVDDFSRKVKIGTSQGNMYSDPVAPGSAYYYWIRFVTTAGVEGPWNALAGTLGRTSDDPAYLLHILTGQIAESHLYGSLASSIDKIDGQSVAIAVNSGLIGTIGAEYTVKIDNAGHVTGFGLSSVRNNPNALPTSAFGVIADRFWIAPPVSYTSETAPTSGMLNGAVWYRPSTKTQSFYNSATGQWSAVPQSFPFVVQTTPVTVSGGQVIEPGVYMDSAFIKKASISQALIGDLRADVIRSGVLSSVTLHGDSIYGGNFYQGGTYDFTYVDQNGTVVAPDPSNQNLRLYSVGLRPGAPLPSVALANGVASFNSDSFIIRSANNTMGTAPFTVLQDGVVRLGLTKLSSTLQSDLFDATHGWSIAHNGDAWFNTGTFRNVNIRGEINGGDYTGWGWPTNPGGTGYHLGQDGGMLLGNPAGGAAYLYFNPADNGGKGQLTLGGNALFTGSLGVGVVTAEAIRSNSATQFDFMPRNVTNDVWSTFAFDMAYAGKVLVQAQVNFGYLSSNTSYRMDLDIDAYNEYGTGGADVLPPTMALTRGMTLSAGPHEVHVRARCGAFDPSNPHYMQINILRSYR